MVASSRARLELKWANKPLLLIRSSSAKRPMVSAASPSRAAIFSARAKIAWRVCSPCERRSPGWPPLLRRKLSRVIGLDIIARTFVFMPLLRCLQRHTRGRSQDHKAFLLRAHQVATVVSQEAYPLVRRPKMHGRILAMGESL